MNKSEKCNKRAVAKFAGAFIAWVIGSGFATGQEVLQFFTSYGFLSYGVVLINLFGFLFIGRTLLFTGYEHKHETSFNLYKYFCGKRLGIFYSWLIKITLFLLIAVLISGAGATLYEYYGVNAYIGSACMSILMLLAYLIGFERLVKIVSCIGPVIIVFSLLVGMLTIMKDIGNLDNVSQYETVLADKHSSPNWILSSFLYLSLNFISGSSYFVQLGVVAQKRKEATLGAVFGSIALILSITIMNTAILLNAGDTTSLAIPVLFLARKISYLLGAIFSIVLILGIFSSSSAMMWSICSRLQREVKEEM